MMPTSFCSKTNQHSGFTLVELVFAIVIISVSIGGMMAAYSSIVSRSADPLVYQQAIEIANSFMEEIAGKDFPASPGTCLGETTDPRSEFDDVCDYNGYSETNIADIDGTNVGLNDYAIAIDVAAAGTDLPVLGVNDAVRIDVTVSHPLGSTITVSSYRVNY